LRKQRSANEVPGQLLQVGKAGKQESRKAGKKREEASITGTLETFFQKNLAGIAWDARLRGMAENEKEDWVAESSRYLQTVIACYSACIVMLMLLSTKPIIVSIFLERGVRLSRGRPLVMCNQGGAKQALHDTARMGSENDG
jgi:hypothetical protein